MAIEAQRLTLEEFLKLPEEEPPLEFIDGVVSQKMSPKGRHSVLQGALVQALNESDRQRELAWAMPELRATFGGTSVIPDVSVYRLGRVPLDAAGEIADDFTEPPDVAIEIASPEQSVSGLVRRCLWYVSHGVQVALLVDPDDRSVLAFRPGEAAIAWRGSDRIDLHEVLPEFELSVEQLFASLRRERARRRRSTRLTFRRGMCIDWDHDMSEPAEAPDTASDYVSSRRIGGAVVTAINEGTVLWAPELTAPADELRRAMPEADEAGRIPADHHAVHIRLAKASVLIDAGLGEPDSAWSRSWLEEWAGARRTPGLVAGLASIGVRPEDITHVIVTHAHYDHVMGLTAAREGQHVPRFPRARVLLSRAEWEGNEELKDPDFEGGARLRAIERHGLLDLVEGGLEVAPRLWMIQAPGESPGHCLVRLASGGQTFYALGDLFHHASEVEHLDWGTPWVEPEAMRLSRQRLLEEATEKNATLVFSHEPFPPWGRVVRTESGYRWQRG